MADRWWWEGVIKEVDVEEARHWPLGWWKVIKSPMEANEYLNLVSDEGMKWWGIVGRLRNLLLGKTETMHGESRQSRQLGTKDGA